MGEGLWRKLSIESAGQNHVERLVPVPVNRRKAEAIAVIEEEAPDWMVSQSFKASFDIFVFVDEMEKVLWLVGCMNGDCGPKHPEDWICFLFVRHVMDAVVMFADQPEVRPSTKGLIALLGWASARRGGRPNQLGSTTIGDIKALLGEVLPVNRLNVSQVLNVPRVFRQGNLAPA